MRALMTNKTALLLPAHRTGFFPMAAEPHGRYLFAGDVEGRLNQLFKRAAAVNKSNGPFDCLFCVGAFFPPADPATAGAGGAGGQSELEDYIAGRAKAPLPTFFIGDIGVGAQRLLEIAERSGGGAATRKEGEAGEEKEKAEGEEGQKEVEEGGKGEGEEKAEGEEKGEGEEIREGGGSKADDEAGEGEEGKGEAGAGGQGDESGGGEKEEDEEVGEGEWRSHRRVKICDNIEWLRGAGIADLCGLKVAYLGGRYDPATYLSGQAGGEGAAVGRQERVAVEALVDAGADGAAIDVLLTNEWPKGVAALTHPSPLPSPPPATSAPAHANVDWAGVGSPVAATLAKELMPRYHVAGSAGVFFARPPYVNSSATSAEDASTSASGAVTRFIGGAGGSTGGAGGAAGGAAPPAPAPCWFCLASPKVETHLVVSVGEHCYVALPKGPLVPGHVLILPIEHFPSVISLPSDALAEMWRYMGALRRCFEAQGRTVVAFERFLQLRAATHAHVNVVPIPQDKADQVLPAFTAAAASHNFQFATVPKPPEGQHMAVVDEVKKHSRGGQYLTVELPDGSLLVHAIDRGAKLPMQLGREVVAGMVGVPERGDWRACKETAEEEAAMADAFKKQFQPFDIMG
ncbi:unnamed protein product [Closterium sp. Yama58-4]|nr:unnamed protein product [Closterium sp. Yama58-4]